MNEPSTALLAQKVTWTDPLTRPTAAEHADPLPYLNLLSLPSRPGPFHSDGVRSRTHDTSEITNWGFMEALLQA
jgi:hypothetical protein